MALCSLCIYYSPMEGNRRVFTFMNNKPEEQFLQGMLYVLVDSAMQFISFCIFIYIIRNTTGADVIRVGTNSGT